MSIVRRAAVLWVLWLVVAVAVIASGCGGIDGPSTSSQTVTSATGTGDARAWEQVLQEAKGTTVRWYIWGGSQSINRFVDSTYGAALKDRYGVILQRVPVGDTVDAVNQVLSEKEAGKDPGSVDLIWINGENFLTLKQAGMLFDGWARNIPNSAYVDWESSAVNRDFGEPIGALESPWSSAQFQFIYDAERMEASGLPRSYAQLTDWVRAHPGRFTYIAPGPGAFQGTRFVKGALFELSGGAAQWAAFDRATWDRWSPQLWAYLKDLEPYLWRKGATYPKDENELDRLFANREVDFTITQAIAGAGPKIDQGTIPRSSRAFVFDHYSIGDYNYVAIPANAPNKAGAQVLANLILDPRMQAEQIVPANGFGLGYGIDITKVTDPAQQEALRKAAAELGPSATPAADLHRSLVGDAAAQYQTLVEQGWRQYVLQGSQ